MTPQMGGYMAPAPVLDPTTSLRGDLTPLPMLGNQVRLVCGRFRRNPWISCVISAANLRCQISRVEFPAHEIPPSPRLRQDPKTCASAMPNKLTSDKSKHMQ